jgi:16S rRNA (cytidine1402-2'-O)-methyltransferase
VNATREGTLFVVATPIGNLGDITLRAIETLRNADRVIAEDTRRTRALLSHLGVSGKPIDRLDATAGPADVARAVEHLVHGERVALVTDAGTPVVSDPGTALVAAAARAGILVVSIPGASAVTAAIAVAGLVTGGFRFLGFLPRAGEARRAAVELVRTTPESVVLFEAPQRCAETLTDLARAAPSRSVVVARELTKMHEELLRGTLAEVAAAPRDEWMGEVTIVIGPAPPEHEDRAAIDATLDARIDQELALGRRAKEIAEALAMETGRPRREIYARVLARRA